jgi:hypothetical protein
VRLPLLRGGSQAKLTSDGVCVVMMRLTGASGTTAAKGQCRPKGHTHGQVSVRLRLRVGSRLCGRVRAVANTRMAGAEVPTALRVTISARYVVLANSPLSSNMGVVTTALRMSVPLAHCSDTLNATNAAPPARAEKDEKMTALCGGMHACAPVLTDGAQLRSISTAVVNVATRSTGGSATVAAA